MGHFIILNFNATTLVTFLYALFMVSQAVEVILYCTVL